MAVLGLEALLAAYLLKSSLGQENKKACWAPSEWLVNAQEPGKGCGLGRTRGVGAAGLTFHGLASVPKRLAVWAHKTKSRSSKDDRLFEEFGAQKRTRTSTPEGTWT